MSVRINFLAWIGLLITVGCTHRKGMETHPLSASDGHEVDGEVPNIDAGRGALLLTRFHSFDEFKKVVDIEYFNQDRENSLFRKPGVKLTFHNNEKIINSLLTAGVNEVDFINAAQGGFYLKLGLLLASPYAVWNRKDLNRIYLLSRRRDALFGDGDIAFYDLAARMMFNIEEADKKNHPEDISDEGYLNTFLHVTTQAFITSMFSEKLGDFIGDVHERRYIPELISGDFSKKQLEDVYNGATDNYLDLLNNEYGQQVGKELKRKFKISRNTNWTPELLADYLNELENYYGWSFQIGLKPFRPTDELIVRFAIKLNAVMQNEPQNSIG